MKSKTVLTLFAIALVSLVTLFTIPVIAQQPPELLFPGQTNVTPQDNQILARVISQEGIPSSPELRSQLDKIVELPDFGAIAFREPLKSSSKKVTPIVLFHGIFGGASHRQFRQLLASLDRTGVPVYIMDLPGIGLSAKPKTTYN